MCSLTENNDVVSRGTNKILCNYIMDPSRSLIFTVPMLAMGKQVFSFAMMTPLCLHDVGLG